jgi:hypothetical protein
VPPRRIIGDLELGNDSNLSNRANPLSGSLFSPMFLSLDIPFFFFPIFFGLTARVIPLRSGLRVFCFHGSARDSTGPSHKADASLRLHAPSLSLVPQRKRGRKKGKRKCPINHVQLIGFLGKDPEKRQVRGNGTNFTVLSVATQQSWKDSNDEWQSKTEWHRVVVIWN